MTETWCIRINVTLSKFITEKSFLPLYRNSANRQIVPKIVQSMSHTITIHDGNKVGSRPKITPKKKTVLSFDMRILCVWRRKTNQFLRRWQCIKSKIGLHIWIESICFFSLGFWIPILVEMKSKVNRVNMKLHTQSTFHQFYVINEHTSERINEQHKKKICVLSGYYTEIEFVVEESSPILIGIFFRLPTSVSSLSAVIVMCDFAIAPWIRRQNNTAFNALVDGGCGINGLEGNGG